MEVRMILYVLTSTVVLVVLHYARNALRRGLRNLPGPFGAKFTSLWRVSITYKGNGVENYRKLHEKYGKIVRTGPNHVAVSDPAMIPLIYGIASKFRKSQFYQASVPFYEEEPLDNIFTAADPALHKALRAPTAQVYSMTNLRNYEPHADDNTAVFIKILKDLEGQVVDLTEYFQWYAFDLISSISFQRRLGFLDVRGDVFEMIGMLNIAAVYLVVAGQLPWLHKMTLGSRRFTTFMQWAFPNAPDPLGHFFKRIEEEINRYDAGEKDTDRKDFLAQLRAKDNPERKYYKRDMMNHLSNNVLAGSDTTAIAMRAIFYYLTKTPRVYKKFVDEILEADKAGKLSEYITYEESLRMPYVQAVIKEAERMHPSLCFPLERVTPPEGATVCGYNLPGGVIIGMQAPIINRNKDIFGDDADVFRPERWLESDPERLKIMDRTFFTFGHGSRACVGRNIATLEIAKFVPEIFRRFDVEWAEPGVDWTLYAVWFYKQSNLKFRWKSREPVTVKAE